jgi:hypothetical protein
MASWFYSLIELILILNIELFFFNFVFIRLLLHLFISFIDVGISRVVWLIYKRKF